MNIIYTNRLEGLNKKGLIIGVQHSEVSSSYRAHKIPACETRRCSTTQLQCSTTQLQGNTTQVSYIIVSVILQGITTQHRSVTLQCSTAQFNTGQLQCSTTQHRSVTLQCSTTQLQCSTTQLQCSITQLQCITTQLQGQLQGRTTQLQGSTTHLQRSTTQYNTGQLQCMKYNTVQHRSVTLQCIQHMPVKCSTTQVSYNSSTTHYNTDQLYCNGNLPGLPSDLTRQMEEFAAKLLSDEIDVYNKQNAKRSDVQWMRTVLTSGTLADKVAALTVLLQESPLHNVTYIDTLLNMARKKNRRENLQAVGNRTL
ncbi:hypothetical protein DPMN_089200 [Dreissena polymorpha]|uniref:Uncharacterized protein n=1 Tax=Dreissena polymorpha TaxID=45954 RepID=A0A9D4KVI3_DREPO|nr:hypothetical protein DPMN_089200 [Dreissena polymorpha]